MRERMSETPRRDSPDMRLARRVEAGPEFKLELEPEDLCAQALAILQLNPAAAKIYRWLQATFNEDECCEALLANWNFLEERKLADLVIAMAFEEIDTALRAFDKSYINA